VKKKKREGDCLRLRCPEREEEGIYHLADGLLIMYSERKRKEGENNYSYSAKKKTEVLSARSGRDRKKKKRRRGISVVADPDV